MTTKQSTTNTPVDSARPYVSLWTIMLAYLQVGVTAFGFAILQKLKTLVRRENWLTEEEMNEGLALVQLYPGSIMIDFTAYAGYKLRGVPGALMATLGFITPSLILMLGLSAAYFTVGQFPWVRLLFAGLEALVVGVMLNIVLDFGQRALKGRFEAIIALVAFATLLFKMNAALIVLAALAVGAIFIRPKKQQKSPMAMPTAAANHWLGIWVTLGVVLVTVGWAWALHSEIGKMGLSFFKIGSVAFGNGATILPLIQSDAVDTYHWLTLKQFADGIALSQITPGPFLVIATFIGYKLGGIWGGLMATFAIFAPSFVMTLIFTEVFSRVRDLDAVKGALAAVLAAFVGLLGVVLFQLGQVGITGSASLVLAASAFVAVRYFKWDLLWIFAVGLVAWAGLVAAGLV